MSTTDFAAWLAEKSALVERALSRQINSPAPALSLAMRDALLGGGKRLRPAMVFAVAEYAPSPAAVVESAAESAAESMSESMSESEKADSSDDSLLAACAVECIHCYSLIHDDLPCMDDAPTRRGKPATHLRHGEATALLAGDCLHSLAFHFLAMSGLPNLAFAHLAAAAGAHGMGGGQALDIADDINNVAQLEQMQSLKTGALFSCAVQLGLLCKKSGATRTAKPATDATKLQAFARAFGLLFQTANDLNGKKKDRRDGKKTAVTLLGEAQTRARLSQLHAAIQTELGGDYPRLTAMADFVMSAADD